MAMKPHLFLLLLFIASILCDPFSVDRPATAAEAATLSWDGIVEGFGKAVEGLGKAREKVKEEYGRNPNQALLELNLCTMYLQAIRNRNQDTRDILEQLEKYFIQKTPMQVFKLCATIVNQQTTQP